MQFELDLRYHYNNRAKDNTYLIAYIDCRVDFLNKTTSLRDAASRPQILD